MTSPAAAAADAAAIRRQNRTTEALSADVTTAPQPAEVMSRKVRESPALLHANSESDIMK